MLNYEVIDEKVIISGATPDEEIVSIPNEILGYPVVKITDHAFLENDHIKSVTIPGSVLSIGEYAFAACKNLERVVIAEGCKEIGEYAFISAPLESLDLPASLISLGEHAFYGTGKRDYADEVLNKNKLNLQTLESLNNKCCIFPESFTQRLNLINSGFISMKSKYNNDQFKKYIAGELSDAKLDLPLLFDKDEVLFSLVSKTDCNKLHIEVSEIYKNSLGVRKENDSDFMVITCDICNEDQILSTLAIKVPYLDSIKFKILKIAVKKTKDHRYYCMLVRCDMDNFGNGNLDMVYDFKMFDKLVEKYETSLKGNLIKQENYNRLIDMINDSRLKVVAGFLSEVKGSPLLTYTIKLFSGVLHDSDFKSERVKAFTIDRLKKYYNDLSNADSLVKIAFDIDDSLGIIMEECGYNIDDLNKRYGISLSDDNGNTLTIKKARSFKKDFNEVMDNYKTYAKYYNLALKEMKKINNEYVSLKYMKE